MAQVICFACSGLMQVESESIGKRVKCPRCDTVNHLPIVKSREAIREKSLEFKWIQVCCIALISLTMGGVCGLMLGHQKGRSDGLPFVTEATRRAEEAEAEKRRLEIQVGALTQSQHALQTKLIFAKDHLKAMMAGPLAERYLHEGRLSDGEIALALDDHPNNDEVRFGLGMIKFVRAVENLGQALHKYGAVSEKTNLPFLRLPVPNNPNPVPITYKALGEVLDAFAMDLQEAERTLAGIKDDKVKLRLRLANIKFDLAGTGKNHISLIELLNKLNAGQFPFQQFNPEFRVHFDRGDVAWLRAYCHLLSAMIEGYRVVDVETGFRERVKDVFPLVEGPEDLADPNWYLKLKMADPRRLRELRRHLVAVCELNREAWEHIRAETDDEFEWLPHPNQNSHLGLPMNEGQIEAWLKTLKQWEELLEGDRLVKSELLQIIIRGHKPGQGLNLKRLFDDPPVDLLSWQGFWNRETIDEKYLETQDGRKTLDLRTLISMRRDLTRLFEGPFAFGGAATQN
jgi:phage FluMu protein Com